jgi:hypothetical protein
MRFLEAKKRTQLQVISLHELIILVTFRCFLEQTSQLNLLPQIRVCIAQVKKKSSFYSGSLSFSLHTHAMSKVLSVPLLEMSRKRHGLECDLFFFQH